MGGAFIPMTDEQDDTTMPEEARAAALSQLAGPAPRRTITTSPMELSVSRSNPDPADEGSADVASGLQAPTIVMPPRDIVAKAEDRRYMGPLLKVGPGMNEAQFNLAMGQASGRNQPKKVGTGGMQLSDISHLHQSPDDSLVAMSQNPSAGGPAMAGDSGGVPGEVQKMMMGGAGAPSGPQRPTPGAVPGAPAKDSDFEDAQGRGNTGALVAGLFGASAADQAGIRSNAVSSLMARRHQATEAAEKDPNSPQSQRARAFLTGTLPDIAKSFTPEQMAGMNKRDVDEMMANGIKSESILSKRYEIEQRLKQQAASAQDANQTKKDIAGQHNDTLRAVASSNASGRADRNSDKADARAEKQKRDDDELQVDGHDFAEGRRPSKDDAKQVKAMLQVRDDMVPDIESFRESIKNGGTSMFGKDSADQETAQARLVMGIKNLEKLRAITRTDASLMYGQVPTTHTLGGKFQQDKTVEEKLGNLERFLNQKLTSAAHAHNYVPKGGAGAGAGADADASPGKPGEVRVINGKRMKWVP